MYAITMTKTKVTFASFIQDQMDNRGIVSNREFARQAGVSAQMINDILNETPREFDVKSLNKLSDFTGFSFLTILSLAFPDIAKLDIDPDVRYDAEMLSQLPPEKKAIARGYINDAYTESHKEKP